MKPYLFWLAVPVMLIPVVLSASPAGFELTWGQQGSAGWSVVETSSGYAAAGKVPDTSYEYFSNPFLIKIAPWPVWPAETLWSKTYHDIVGEFRCIKEVPDDGFIMTGILPDLSDSGGPHVLVTRTDSTGEIIWTNDEIPGEGHSITRTQDGGFMIAGRAFDAHWVTDLLLAKVDSAGDSVWSRTYGHESGDDEARCIRSTEDGNYVVSGTYGMSESYLDGDVWWMKVDSAGEIVWEHKSEEEHHNYRGYSIQETQDTGYIIGAGREVYSDTLSAHSLVLIRTDQAGEVQWKKEYLAGFSMDERIHWWVEQTSDRGYIATGHPWSLVKTDPEGDTTWIRSYHGDKPGEVYGHYVCQTSEEGYLAVGRDGEYLYLLKTDSQGYTGVTENPDVDADVWVVQSVGKHIRLRYSNYTSGFHASVFDVTGRKVSEIHDPRTSGTVIWPATPATHQSPGVYFIQPMRDNISATKVVITW